PGRGTTDGQRIELYQRSCHVLRGILGLAVLFRHYHLQGSLLVAYRAADHFRVVCGAGWSFAHLPGRSLGERCFRFLSPERNVAWHRFVDLFVFKGEECACFEEQDDSTSAKICEMMKWLKCNNIFWIAEHPARADHELSQNNPTIQ